MQYKETREQSAELLRLALSQMARHPAGFHPQSYALWYEYFAQINSALVEAVDACVAERGALSDRDIRALYEQHVAQRDLQASERTSTGIARLLQQVSGAANEAEAHVRSYGAGLDGYRQRLGQHIDQQQLEQVLSSLIRDTERVQSSTDAFHEQLRQNSQEVVQLRAQLEIAQGLACRDPLTGLLNRRGLDQHLQRDWEGKNIVSCLMLVDIDRFKSINDSHGHLLGDKVIVAVARALQNGAGSRGPVARVGGEEFAALLLDIDTATASAVAEQVRSAVERGRIRRAEGSDSVGGVTVSIGIASFHDGETFESMMSRADRALYESKHAGRNRITLAAAPDIASVA